MKNIVLVGLSGCGKTTLGRLLAKQLEIIFVDLDDEIEKTAGISIAQIFEKYGEEHFRALEEEAVKKACLQSGQVISTGGGAVLRAQNTQLLRQNGFVIYLNRPVESIVETIEITARPLLQQGAQKLHSMAKQRQPYYQNSAHLVLCNNGSKKQALQMLLSACLPLCHSGYAVIGQPIGHSLSPTLHAAAFKAQSLNCQYTAFSIPRGNLPQFVAGVRASKLKGFNVTIPHKTDIIPFLDGVEEEAALCGAVNTVVHKNGKLYGYNTDMGGLNLALKRCGSGYQNSHVLLLGAGGAARGVALKAARQGAQSLCILARKPAAAQHLASTVQNALGAKLKTEITSGKMNDETLKKQATLCNLLINASPLGMQGYNADFTNLNFIKKLPPNAHVCDLIYSPPTTNFLAKAQEQGLHTQNGLGMLICQALLAQEHFLDKKLNITSLFKIVEEELL